MVEYIKYIDKTKYYNEWVAMTACTILFFVGVVVGKLGIL